MKKKRPRNRIKERTQRKRPNLDLHPQTKRAIWAVVLFALDCIVILSFWGKAGLVGDYFRRASFHFFGKGAFLLPVLLAASAFIFYGSSRKNVYGTTALGVGLFLGGFLGILTTISGPDTSWGGVVGKGIATPLETLLGFWGALTVLAAVVLIAFLIFLNIPFGRISKRESSPEDALPTFPGEETGRKFDLRAVVRRFRKGQDSKFKIKSLPQEAGSREAIDEVAASIKKEMKKEEHAAPREPIRIPYRRPPLDLLEGDSGQPSSGDIKANANIIKRTLQNFGIEVEMGEVNIGPTVTQYTLKPAEGIKLSRITGLSNDLSLALAAHPLRIEAPIPGKSLVGIEIPNKQVQFVRLRSLLSNPNFLKGPSPLTIGVGRDVAGNPVFIDIERMPHMLIAGSTGSGKTIALNTLILSLLMRNSPRILRFILIDPKRVEFSVFNDIPHLLTPAITDVQKTINVLRWAVKEMDRRFDMLSAVKARDIGSYNATISKNGKGENELLPYLVIIVDELADLMMARGREVEATVVRLAQMARAVGIHLVLATQRPSVEVITGLIKANITSRIAFQVASQVDSRTILDMAGAEKLLGNGDMLYLSAETSKPRRLQGAYVSEHEVKAVSDFIRNTARTLPDELGIAANLAGETLGGESSQFGGQGNFEEEFFGEDPLYEEAHKEVTRARKASASFLQRRLRIGYARAARLIDILEERGVVGPGEGAKPREVYLEESESEDENA